MPKRAFAIALVPVALAEGIHDSSLLTAAPTAAPPRIVSVPTETEGIHLSESALAGIIVGCVLGGILLGLVTSAGIFICLSRREDDYHEHFDEMDEEDPTSSTDRPEKGYPLNSLSTQSPYPPTWPSQPPARPPRRSYHDGSRPLERVTSTASDGFTPTLPTITAGASIGTPADWEAERAVSVAAPSSTILPLGYSEYRPATPTRFWRGIREKRGSGFTIRSAKAKPKRASIVTLKSNKSAKSRRASILTVKSKLSGKSGNSRKRHGAPPLPPLPFSRRVPVPPLSPSLQPTRPPPRRPKKRVMHEILPDPPAQL